MYATPSRPLMPLERNLAVVALINDKKAANISRPVLIGSGAVMATTNSATTALRFTLASTPTQDVFNGATLEIAIDEPLVSYAR